MWCWSEFKTRYQYTVHAIHLKHWCWADTTTPLQQKQQGTKWVCRFFFLTFLSGFCPWSQCSKCTHFYLVAIYQNAFAQPTNILHINIFTEYTEWYVLVIQQLAMILSYNVKLIATYQNALKNNVSVRSCPVLRQISERKLLCLKVSRLHALTLSRAVLTWKWVWSICEMYWQEKTKELCGKPVSVLLCAPQISYALAQNLAR